MVAAQQTRDLGLPPPFDIPALPPAVNPALPPPTGQRYLPGTRGPFADPDKAPVTQPSPRALRQLGGESFRGDVRLSLRASKAVRIDRMTDLIPYLHSCWVAPRDAGKASLDATIRFSLTRSGALVGEPRVTYVSRLASKAQREAIIASIRSTLTSCAPLPLSDRFGATVAGRPISIRFIIDAPSTGI